MMLRHTFVLCALLAAAFGAALGRADLGLQAEGFCLNQMLLLNQTACAPKCHGGNHQRQKYEHPGDERDLDHAANERPRRVVETQGVPESAHATIPLRANSIKGQ